MNKYWETFRYQIDQKKPETTKRRNDQISKSPLKSTSTNLMFLSPSRDFGKKMKTEKTLFYQKK